MRPLLLAAALALPSGVGAAAEAAASRGAELYARCAACHSVGHDRVGPRHCDLLGRRAGSVPDFDYSAAMKKSGTVWTAKTLDRFLADPLKAIPGTSMTYAGIKDPRERSDIIAYLSSVPACKR